MLLKYFFSSIGEFGIVYKGHLMKDFGLRVTNVVAVKTLKGTVFSYNIKHYYFFPQRSISAFRLSRGSSGEGAVEGMCEDA